MASTKGRQASFNRFKHRQVLMELQDAGITKRVTQRVLSRSLTHPHRCPLDRMRQALLFERLHELQLKGLTTSQFEIVWHQNVEWAKGPTIEPYTHIFDEYVEGHWRVAVVDDIQGSGKSGWLFTKVA